MPNTSLWVLVGGILLTMLPATVSWAKWSEITDEEARIHLHGHGSLGEVWANDYTNNGHDYHCHPAWWGWETGPAGIEAHFCWTDDPIGWHRDHLSAGAFVDWFNGTDGVGRGDLTRGVDLDGAVGALRTMQFELDSYDGCIGFILPWLQRQGRWREYYARFLALYGCGREGNVISAAALRSILQGFAVDGEFDALFE